MARQETVVITDDLDGTEGAETYRFGFRGSDYEIDLSEKTAGKLQTALAPFLNAARKTGGATSVRRGGRRGGASSAADRGGSDTAAIREWARSNGIKVSERGRIPQTVRDQYAAANN